jgi:hypothetical protein
MYIHFCKIKNIIILGRASTMGEAIVQAWHNARAGLTQTLLNRSASGWPVRHGPFDYLYLCSIMMLLASVSPTSFVILLLFSLPSCLRLRATPFSAEGVGADTCSPYLSNTSPDTDPRSGYCTSTRTFHSMRAPSFSPSSDVPFVFPALALFFLPNLLPMVAAASRPMPFDTGTGQVGLAPGLSSCVPLRRTWWL